MAGTLRDNLDLLIDFPTVMHLRPSLRILDPEVGVVQINIYRYGYITFFYFTAKQMFALYP